MNTIFRKTVCSLMAALIGYTPMVTSYVLAEEAAKTLNEYGKEANAYGRELGTQAKDAGPTFDGMNITFSAGGENYSIGKDDLAPKDNGKEIRYKHTAEDFENQQSLYNDGGAMDEKGAEQKDELFMDSESENPTLEGEVYAVLVDMAKKEKADYIDSVFLEKTSEILADMENVLKDLVTCDANSALDKEYTYTHLEDLRECQQVVDQSMTCYVQHDYTAGIVVHRAGPFNIDSCGEGCTTIWIGNPADQNFHTGKDGTCYVFQYELEIGILNPSAIQSVELTDIYWDDQMQVYFGTEGREVKLLQLPYPETFVPQFDETPGVRPVFTYPGPFSGAAHESCEQKISWHWQTSLDITNYFKKNIDTEANYKFRIRVAVSYDGEGYARMNIHYDPSKVVSGDIWKPKDCVDTVNAVFDGFAKGEWKCVEMPELDSSGCTWINGAQVCENHLAPSPMKGISPLCKKIEVTTEYNFYKGDTGCWKALSGFDEQGNAIYEEICGGENIGGNLDTCADYENNPDCKFVSAQCTDGAKGDSGTCYVNDVVYDCGKDVRLEIPNADTTYDCKGISCLDEDCIDVDRTINTNFAKVNAMLNAVQYMAQDMECTGLDENGKPIGNQNVDCSVFGGTSGYCKIAVGGWQNCCKPIGGPGVAEYIDMITRAQRLHSSAMTTWANVGTSILENPNYTTTLAEEMAGQYAEVVGDVTNVMKAGVDWLTKPFASSMDNIYTFTDYLAAPFKWFKEKVIDEIKKKIVSIMNKIMKDAGIDLTKAGIGGGDVSAEQMMDKMLTDALGQELGSAVGSVISFVGWVYLAYQVANIVIQLVYKCEQEEYEMLSKKEAKNCHYVGSYCKSKKLGMCIVKHQVYCCYQSPLSRIMNEQIKATQPELLGNQGDWGSPEHPKCGGIPMDSIDKINWDLINLDEWTALLMTTGNMVVSDEIDIDSMTGAASNMNWTGTQGVATKWGIPSSAEGSNVIEKPQVQTATMSLRSMKEKSSNTDRKNTIVRTEDKLFNQDVDGLRIAAGKCITLNVGNGVMVRGGCKELSDSELVCRKDGGLTDCEDIAYQNSLSDLLGNKLTSQEYWDQGYRCIRGDLYIDCSTLYSKEAYIRALEEYARIIGGTTYLNRYVCLDKSGTFTSAICEQAMLQNYCECLSGEFQCQDGNKVIACSSLGATRSNCECLEGACVDQCPYGGIPDSMTDNPYHQCNSRMCPYGFVSTETN